MKNYTITALIALLALAIALPVQATSQPIFTPPQFKSDSKEGKKHTDVDLPVSKPEPKDDEDWIPPIDDEGETVVYVIDISCSMAGNRLAKAKVELKKSIQSLPANFKFSIVAFSCQLNVWQSELVEATENNKDEAANFIGGLAVSGATGTGDAVVKGLELHRANKLVILLTDGAPNCLSGSGYGSTNDHLQRILAKNTQQAQVDVFAIQAWNGSYKKFCQDLAQRTGGKYREVN